MLNLCWLFMSIISRGSHLSNKDSRGGPTFTVVGVDPCQIDYNPDMSHSLKPMHVQAALSTRWLGKSYYYFDTVGSTNDTLREMLSAGDQHQPPAGTVVLAEYQSRGRGRLDRRWLAPRGSCLLLSILFRPQWKQPSPFREKCLHDRRCLHDLDCLR